MPKAYVVLAAGHEPDAETAASILAYCRDHLAPYKRIRRIEFAELPKTISGKIRRVELRGRESREHGDGSDSDAADPELEFWEDDLAGQPDRPCRVRSGALAGPGPEAPAKAWAMSSQRSTSGPSRRGGVPPVDPLGDQQGELEASPVSRLVASSGPQVHSSPEGPVSSTRNSSRGGARPCTANA